jgi:deoxyribonuclease-4
MRVRQVLNSLDSGSRAALKKLLPAGVKMPELETQRYPSALLGCFPKAESYSLLGILAESLLARPKESITLEELVADLRILMPDISAATVTKLRSSVTTAPFLEALVATRTALEEQLKSAEAREGQVVTHSSVEGHPDLRTDTIMIEIKLTGLPKQNWVDFLFQLFAYGALAPEAQDLLLVLPLQRSVVRFDIRGWGKRVAYRDFLVGAAEKVMAFQSGGALVAALLREEHLIGHHAPKMKSLVDTVRALPDAAKPYQIFLGGPQTAKLSVADAELAAAAAEVGRRGVRVYVHSQYIINLSNRKGESWAESLLIKNLQYAVAMGCRGVVVHVGKSVGSVEAEAVVAMRETLKNALAHATPDCPLLLETPAGQGTELLRGAEEFMDFVESFGDQRLRACLDTCHVFACGHKPLEYLGKMRERAGLLKLVHYNDSAAPCGSCVDRHAYMGTGHIGMEGMKAIAELCTAGQVPMVIE